MSARRYLLPGAVILLIILIGRFFLFSFEACIKQKQPFVIKVALARMKDHLTLASDDTLNIYEMKTGKLLKKVGAPRSASRSAIRNGLIVSPVEEGIMIGGDFIGEMGIRVERAHGRGVSLNGALYGGSINILNLDAKLTAVNNVELEDYLKGVVPCEVNNLWPVEALKAQAIASRSFAVYEALRNEEKAFHLTSGILSQVYKGRGSERWRTTRAVEATRGKVLKFNGEILPAYFHSCCGGHTQDIARVWGEKHESLKGVKCKSCRWLPYFRWQVKLSPGKIIDGLDRSNYSLKTLKDIREGPRDVSGRLEFVRLKLREGWFQMDVRDFRSAMGSDILKSAMFYVKKYPFFYTFSGYGWGHGVGMCQWGAFGLSLKRWKAERILKYYYPGSDITDISAI